VNPARSTEPALFVGGWAVQQLWLFWVAPLLGAAAAGFIYKALLEGPVEAPPVTGRPVGQNAVASGPRARAVRSSGGSRMMEPLPFNTESF